MQASLLIDASLLIQLSHFLIESVQHLANQSIDEWVGKCMTWKVSPIMSQKNISETWTEYFLLTTKLDHVCVLMCSDDILMWSPLLAVSL